MVRNNVVFYTESIRKKLFIRKLSVNFLATTPHPNFKKEVKIYLQSKILSTLTHKKKNHFQIFDGKFQRLVHSWKMFILILFRSEECSKFIM
jgi:hypothetical protein